MNFRRGILAVCYCAISVTLLRVSEGCRSGASVCRVADKRCRIAAHKTPEKSSGGAKRVTFQVRKNARIAAPGLSPPPLPLFTLSYTTTITLILHSHIAIRQDGASKVQERRRARQQPHERPLRQRQRRRHASRQPARHSADGAEWRDRKPETLSPTPRRPLQLTHTSSTSRTPKKKPHG